MKILTEAQKNTVNKLSLYEIEYYTKKWLSIKNSNDNDGIKRKNYDDVYSEVTNKYFGDLSSKITNDIQKIMTSLYLEYGFKILDGNNKKMNLVSDIMINHLFNVAILQFIFMNSNTYYNNSKKLFDLANNNDTVCVLYNANLYKLQPQTSLQAIINEINARNISNNDYKSTLVCQHVYEITPAISLSKIIPEMRLKNPDDPENKQFTDNEKSDSKEPVDLIDNEYSEDNDSSYLNKKQKNDVKQVARALRIIGYDTDSKNDLQSLANNISKIAKQAS